MTEERYEFTAGAKKKIFILGAVGIVLFILGVFMAKSDGHGDEAAHALNTIEETSLLASTDENAIVLSEDAHGEAAHHETAPWLKRIFSNLWINNVYFTGLAIIGLFFITIQYASQAGWSAGMKRIPLAMASYLPIAGILMLVSWFVVKGDVFHWTHASLYLPVAEGGDSIIQGKAALWYWPNEIGSSLPLFYIARMVIFFGLWYWFFVMIKKHMLAEDIDGGLNHWKKARSLSAIFLVIFAVSSSVSAWDWVMSIDPHWFSTMFGWYIFSSWWVSGLAFITIVVVMLKRQGYLKIVNENHLHDIGKFVFGFSIFWTYIWFSQFLLIYYANIPEEVVYFVERMKASNYAWVFYTNILLNFVLPFLLLMTRDAKRQMSMLMLVSPIIVIGHWVDFYLMVTPGVMKTDGAIGLLEIGMLMIFLALFIYIMLHNLAKAPLVAKNHPMLEESLHHHI
ncbi:MAG: quinol:cytochrome C oxidoreductase [Cyclobacteriaceae bacterium]|nr:quinol:cytochrome C oxidoreductase [Cyclobacteriaceae bacterium]